jgi:hypothetical protein
MIIGGATFNLSDINVIVNENVKRKSSFYDLALQQNLMK